MNNCKFFKIRTKKGKKYFYCFLKKSIVNCNICRECTEKEYKKYKPIKKRTYKQAKREKNRDSIIVDNIFKCVICGTENNIILHECIYGRNRQNSIKYNLVIPLCVDHHTGNNGIHHNKLFDDYYHKLAQNKWEETYGNRDEFIKIFGQSWL